MNRSTPLAAAVVSIRPAIISMAIIGIFVNLTLLVPPLYMMQVYDRVLSSGNLGTLLMLSVIAVTMLAVYGVLEYSRQGILVHATRQFDSLTSEALFKALSIRVERDGFSTGGQALKDVAVLREALSSGMPASLSDVPWTPFFIALCWLMHPALGAVALVASILIFSVALLTDALTRAGLKSSLAHALDANRTANAMLQQVDVVRGLGMRDALFSRWLNSHEAMMDAQTTTSERAAMTLALSKFTRLAVQSLMLGAGAWLAVQNEISPGLMIAGSIIMGRALAPVEQLVANWRRITSARAAFLRLQAIFDALPDEADLTELPKPTGCLSVEGLAVVPPGSAQPSLIGLNFNLQPGTVLAVVGRSGSGKSSLARAIAGIWPAAKGAIRLDGATLDQWPTEMLGQHIGYVPQSATLFDGSVADNIARLQQASSESVFEAAKLAGVHEAILRLPNGYDTVLGEKGMTVSGGMCQRIALARALFRRPSLIVLDEPNANLDTEGDAALAVAIRSLRSAGSTVIVVTHKPQILGSVDQVLVLCDGRQQALGPRDEVLRPLRPAAAARPEQGSTESRTVAA